MFEDTESWLAEREQAYREFRERFKASKQSPDNVKDVFKDFLYFRNNKSWRTFYRTGIAALHDPEKLHLLITSLLDESVDIRSRIDSVLVGSRHIEGIGRNIVTNNPCLRRTG